MISQDTIDEIIRLPIKDVVGHYIDLKPAGHSLKACSPFSNEKTPSFYVVPSKNIFKDFSTGKGGGGIRFVMEHLKLSYPLAVKEICNEFNITFQDDFKTSAPPDPSVIERIELLYKLNMAAAKKYCKILYTMPESHTMFPIIDAELKRRNITEEIIMQWQLGYAPDDWKFLATMLIAKGHYQNGIDLGLIKTKNSNNYDTFRHRLMIPIIDERGRVVSFGGRELPGAVVTATDSKGMKYINGPETDVYVKSRTLFGLYQAIPAIQRLGYAILTEGYFDVISMHIANCDNTVGTCGTAVTPDQVSLLKRYTQKVMFAYDGDKAGISATNRSIDLFLAQGFEVEVLPLPAGKDPDDFVRMFKPTLIS